MTARRPLPKHGTVARYRREVADAKAGKGNGPCERCRTANNARAKNARTNRAALERRANLKIVEPVTDDGHAEQLEQDVKPRRRTQQPKHTIGLMEAAVDKDIAELDGGLAVPFHHSLTVLARQLAREVDEPSTPANVRSQSSRQLFEVLKSLRTQKEGDDNSAVAVALQASGFGLPLVP
jgi:hypothetical protein